MSHSPNLRLVKGGDLSESDGPRHDSRSPDHQLFGLIEEARLLEAKDCIFNREFELAIEQSEAWINGDRHAALKSEKALEVVTRHEPVIERLMEVPEIVAMTPAYTQDGLIEKLRFLATLVDGVEADLVMSVIQDLGRQSRD